MSETNDPLQTPIYGVMEYKKPYPFKGTKEKQLEWAKKYNENEDNERDRIYVSQLKKMEEIAKKNDINPNKKDAWYLLALTLASKEYLGLTIKKTRKIKNSSKWPTAISELLFCHVYLLRQNDPKIRSDEAAIKILIIKEPWRSHLLPTGRTTLYESEMQTILKKISNTRHSERIKNILKQVKKNPEIIKEYNADLELIAQNFWDQKKEISQ